MTRPGLSRGLAAWLALSLSLAVAGCAPLADASTEAPAPWRAPSLAPTLVPTALMPAAGVSAARVLDPTPTPPEQAATAPSPTPLPTPDCRPGWCLFPGHFVLARPIADARWDSVDPTYRYGSTQGGTRDPHSGVELPAPDSTPVYAAAGGRVVAAAGDATAQQLAGSAIYGNLVILEHHFPELDQPLYTLYAHLSEIDVTPGQAVQAGDLIGRVGQSGAAIGPHLHFEVRLGGPGLENTRNPELWLAPHRSTIGAANGAIAGLALASDGGRVTGSVVIQSSGDAPLTQGGAPGQAIYVESYATPGFHADDRYGENFAAGDLAPGWYRVSFNDRGRLVEQDVQVFPGQVTVVNFK